MEVRTSIFWFLVLNERYEFKLKEDVAWLMICYLRAKYVEMYNFLYLW